METLQPRQKQEWKSSIDDHWIRTGCNDLWDAIFIAFREYRDATPSTQQEMIQKKTNIHISPDDEWIDNFHQKYYEKYSERKTADEETQLFFNLLPLKLISTEIIPYIQNYILIHNNNLSMEQLYEEIIDKSNILAEYRQKKKNIEISPEDLKDIVGRILTHHIFKEIQNVTYEMIQRAMMNMEHHLIIISPQEEVLFDSKTWGDGLEGVDYQDVVVVLAHPNNTYDSVGRISYTKDGHQRISRLFHYDDDIIETLRK